MSRKLRAVHDDDLDEFLESLGILKAIDAGRVTCRFCGDAVSQANLHAVFPFQGSVETTCDRPACVRALNRFKFNQ